MNPDSELMKEGYKSYHKAVFAVMEFRRQVEKVIRTVVGERAADLAAAMNLGDNALLDVIELPGGISPYTVPYALSHEYDGSRAMIGIKFPNTSNSPWIIWVYFWIDDGQRNVTAYLWLKSPGSAFESIVGSGRLERDENDAHGAFILEIIPSDGSRDLSTVCNSLMDRWIEVWTKVGGLRQFLPEKV